MDGNNIKYNALLKSVYEKVLKPAGFRKYGGNFRRFFKSQIFTTGQVVSFVKKEVDGAFTFTVLLGKKSSFNGEPTASFKTNECTIPERTYLTELSGDGFKRFVIGGDTEPLETELCRLIKEYALPWFGLI